MGRRVVFFRPGVTDPMLASIGSDVMALTSLVLDLLCADEENQIKGCVYVADAKGVKMPHFTVFTPQYYFRVGKTAEVSDFSSIISLNSLVIFLHYLENCFTSAQSFSRCQCPSIACFHQ